ncbi:hypothetical protein O181_083667 [Austropuccinia psidii MF-1]|uniref:DDE Tnp4 domain-containing protein n=1 Tax=Austropuccinia psidii MF-1 TaxID=1389203 RepID=A0A9Q3FSS0_9BASI|nr:hypothetical protein [Austropuccinia psidii MF-1]
MWHFQLNKLNFCPQILFLELNSKFISSSQFEIPPRSQRKQFFLDLQTAEYSYKFEYATDEELEEEIFFLNYFHQKGYLTNRKFHQPLYIYQSSDLEGLLSWKFQQLCQALYTIFQDLVKLISMDKRSQNNANFRQCDIGIQLAVSLCRFGSNGTGSLVGRIRALFGIGQGTVILYTKRIIAALFKHQSSYLVWPNYEECRELSQVMQAKGFPGCIGFIDGSWIPLSQRSPNDSEVHFDRK